MQARYNFALICPITSNWYIDQKKTHLFQSSNIQYIFIHNITSNYLQIKLYSLIHAVLLASQGKSDVTPVH